MAGADLTIAVLVGPKNARWVLGIEWSVAKRAALDAGLRPVRIGRAGCFRVGELLEALERADKPADVAPVLDLRDELVRRMGGSR